MPDRWLAWLVDRLERSEGPAPPAPVAGDLSDPFRRLLAGGLVHAACGRREEAITDLTAAARLRTDEILLYLVLGHLQRLRGQSERAVRLHQMILKRADLDRAGSAAARLALAFDYRSAGLYERALASVEEALRLEPKEPAALDLLARLHEAMGNWRAALQAEERLLKAQPRRPRLIAGFLHYEIGCRLDEGGQVGRAARWLLRALKVHPGVIPAYLRLGDLHYRADRPDRALVHWERLLDRHPRRAHLAFERLEGAYSSMGLAGKLAGICRRLAAADPADWRSRLYLAEEASRRGDEEASARWGLEALQAGPRSLAAHRAYWKAAAPSAGLPPRALRDFLKATSGPGAGDDPHVCGQCHYRASELLWRCPQCHAWATFSEDRG